MGKSSRRSRASKCKQELSLEKRTTLTTSLLASLTENGITFSGEPEGMRVIMADMRRYKEEGERLETTWSLPTAGGKLFVILPRYEEEEPMLRYSPSR